MVSLGAVISHPPNDLAASCLQLGPFAPFATIQQSTARLRPQPTPLFEKEWDLRGPALIAYLTRPFGQHWSRARSAFAPHYHPVDAIEIDIPYGSKQRLDR